MAPSTPTIAREDRDTLAAMDRSGELNDLFDATVAVQRAILDWYRIAFRLTFPPRALMDSNHN